TKGNDENGAHDNTNGREIIPLRIDVGNVECAMLAHPAKLWRISTDLFTPNGYRYGAKMSTHNRFVPLDEPQRHVIDPANPRRALDDGIEHWLNVRRRAADDADHLGRSSLMF